MSRTSRGRELSLAVARALQEDRFGHDRTTRALRLGTRPVVARITAQRAGVLSGIVPARLAARLGHVRVIRSLRDGDRVRPGTEVMRLRGTAGQILGVERTVLNYLMHLSGVASATARALRAVRGAHPPLEIWGTRKTLPGLRDLEKEAIVHGGGRPHRRDLQETILVKGTHLSLLPLPKVLARLPRGRGATVKGEVEVRTTREALRAARAGVRTLLIDNAGPARARAIVERLKKEGLRRPVWIELSGGITPENAGRYARVGANALSLGSVTHSSPALPFHLEILTSARPSP